MMRARLVVGNRLPDQAECGSDRWDLDCMSSSRFLAAASSAAGPP
jgi:hypothetical protein